MDRIIAHRGGADEAPENTLAAFIQAHKLGIRWMELDVCMMGDSSLVVIHDDSLDRTSNLSGALADLSYKDLWNVDMGSWFSDAFKGERLPLFSQLLVMAKARGMALNVEIKLHSSDRKAFAKAVMQELKDAEFAAQDLVISAFDHQVLADIRSLDTDVPLGLLYDQDLSDWREKTSALNAATLHMSRKLAHANDLAEFKALGLTTYCYTVNDEHEAQSLFDKGLDGIFTDRPTAMLKADF